MNKRSNLTKEQMTAFFSIAEQADKVYYTLTKEINRLNRIGKKITPLNEGVPSLNIPISNSNKLVCLYSSKEYNTAIIFLEDKFLTYSKVLRSL